MKLHNSIAIIKTRKESVVSCHMVVTEEYMKLMPSQFTYKDCYICKEFEILENVGGDVVVKAYSKLENADIYYENTIRIRNVAGIAVMSEHEI
nr:MAG TPA: hypothetical protein [Caudoviricetes sp.]